MAKTPPMSKLPALEAATHGGPFSNPFEFITRKAAKVAPRVVDSDSKDDNEEDGISMSTTEYKDL